MGTLINIFAILSITGVDLSTTIKVSVKTKEKLNRIKGELMTKSGDQFTYDDVISWLIDKREVKKI